MLHRHLNHQRYTLAAIDNIISSGKRDDWDELRQAVLDDQEVLKKVEKICTAHIENDYAQRHHFWMNYARKHAT